MKLQIGGQQWRLRVDEDELQRLRDGHVLLNASELPAGASFRFSLALRPGAQADLQRHVDSWEFLLPTGSVESYVQRLPCREGLVLPLPVSATTGLQLVFEVDVRDSVNRRGAVRRPR